MKGLSDLVFNYPTKYKEGFTNDEIKQLFANFPQINMEKVENAFMGNTCKVKDGLIISYHCDVLLALNCGLESTNL